MKERKKCSGIVKIVAEETEEEKEVEGTRRLAAYCVFLLVDLHSSPHRRHEPRQNVGRTRNASPNVSEPSIRDIIQNLKPRLGQSPTS
eukprot:maker-scaffold262_size232883-snap-gene-0.13 protein:Tk12534 transcript:maker-scaffold262_size232883-snap-gene-0.13-mRNA-1 annotation:"hypothetical protein"